LSIALRVEMGSLLQFSELESRETINYCNIKLLSRLTNRVDKDYRTNKTAIENPIDEQDSNANKDIKEGMHKFEAKIKAGKAPEGDATRSDE
jgi:hypothetical protein